MNLRTTAHVLRYQHYVRFQVLDLYDEAVNVVRLLLKVGLQASKLVLAVVLDTSVHEKHPWPINGLHHCSMGNVFPKHQTTNNLTCRRFGALDHFNMNVSNMHKDQQSVLVPLPLTFRKKKRREKTRNRRTSSPSDA